MKKSLVIICSCIILMLTYTIWFLPKLKFSNQVGFSGDAWQYQSLAVNLAKGGNFMKQGQIYGDLQQIYKFSPEIAPINQARYQYFIEIGKNGGNYSFFRTPGYILFLSLIYRVFGVEPIIAKTIQLLLLIFIAAFLPLLGFYYWQKKGFISGFLAGILFLKEYARDLPRDFAISSPGDIMGETLIAFTLFIFIFLFIYWQKRHNYQRAFLLGTFSAMCILIKATNVFIPLFVLIYCRQFLKNKTEFKINLFAYGAGLALLIIPWSAYASINSGKLVLISTQTNQAFLEGNNEFAIDGGWHPEGYSYATTQTFYNQPEIESLSLPLKLIAFFQTYPSMIPSLFGAKIQRGFGGYIYLAFTVILLIFNIIRKQLPLLLRLLASIGVIKLILNLYNSPAIFNISLPPFRMDLLLSGLLIILLLKKKFRLKPDKLDLPAPFVILFLSYLLLTLLTLGWPRYIQVLDFIFMLMFVKYGIDLITNFIQESVKIINYAK